MIISVEISLYPLRAEYVNYIQDFIDRLHSYPNLHIRVDETSTFISGESEIIWEALQKETTKTWEDAGQSVFVMKWLLGDLKES